MNDINNTFDVTRAQINPRSFSMPFWEATREKRLLIQYDRTTQRFQFFPRANSIYNGRVSALEWREVSGQGEIFSYTIARRSREPFQGHEPYFIALVTLREGVNVMANVVNCTQAEMRIGLSVRPHWLPLQNGMHLLMFEPDGS